MEVLILRPSQYEVCKFGGNAINMTAYSQKKTQVQDYNSGY